MTETKLILTDAEIESVIRICLSEGALPKGGNDYRIFYDVAQLAAQKAVEKINTPLSRGELDTQADALAGNDAKLIKEAEQRGARNTAKEIFEFLDSDEYFSMGEGEYPEFEKRINALKKKYGG